MLFTPHWINLLFFREERTLRLKGLTGIDFAQINYGEYQVLPQTTQLTFTCSKSAIKLLEKGVKYVQR